MTKGIDCAFSPHPPASAIRDAGFGFVCRYMSPMTANDGNGKNLLAAELGQLRAAGLSVVVVEESTAGRMRSGHAAGVADAQHANAVTAALGMGGVPVYFACDFDATESDQALINSYLDGAASVIGHARTGIYGGYYPVRRALDAGKAAYAWQTSAWSGGQWDPRAHIRQQGSVRVGGVTVDLDEATASDYGQWPRPGTAKPAPAPAQGSADIWPAGVTLKEGSTGPAVKALQYALRDGEFRLSATIGAVDGDFGSKTLLAVRVAQQILGLNVDGIAGPKTRSALVARGCLTAAGEGR